MSLNNIFNITGSAMSAQSVRLNTVASNLANAGVVSSTEAGAYRSRQPIFSAVMSSLGNAMDNNSPHFGVVQNQPSSVRIVGIVESNATVSKHFQPDHPMANKDGYIFKSNVNSIEEMANMMSASRAYQNNVEVFNTAKQMLLKTLAMGRR